MSYAHIQIILYRPFLHYASPSTQAMITDKRTYACAAACVSVSRNVVHITSEMKRSGLLTGAYWFSMYTTFFAILSLLFYAIENPQNTTSEVILRDAHEGRDTLAKLSPSSMAADRSSQTLAVGEVLLSAGTAANSGSSDYSNNSRKLSGLGDLSLCPCQQRSGLHLQRTQHHASRRRYRTRERTRTKFKVQVIDPARRTGVLLRSPITAHFHFLHDSRCQIPI